MMGTLFGATEYVKVRVNPATLDVENGTPAAFTVNVGAQKGIHVNAQPSPTIKSETKGAELSITSLPKNGDYLDLGKPIEVRCNVKGFSPGIHTVRFEMRFTFCSDTEGWCSMGTDSSSIQIRVTK